MYFADSFEMFIAMIKASKPEIIIVPIITIRFVSVISGKISEIATAAPVLVLPMTNKVMNDKPITIVFIPPKRTKNPFLLWLINSEPITAACPAPIPGRKEHRGAEIIEPRVAFANSFFGILIFFNGEIFCFPILVFCFKLIMIAL